MSICDLIVVMKDGLLQQIGKPQEVYDDPVNLFVAKFLGTPPINVFDGRVSGGKLYIGDAAVMDVSCPDGHVTAAIRPEGFEPAAGGAFRCRLRRIEVMGRDTSVVCDHDAFTGEAFRAIIDSDELKLVSGDTVSFDLKENKVFLFHPETGERIRF